MYPDNSGHRTEPDQASRSKRAMADVQRRIGEGEIRCGELSMEHSDQHVQRPRQVHFYNGQFWIVLK